MFQSLVCFESFLTIKLETCGELCSKFRIVFSIFNSRLSNILRYIGITTQVNENECKAIYADNGLYSGRRQPRHRNQENLKAF